MQSATLSSKACPWWNTTLFLKNVTRFWPIWGLYGVLWLLILPLTILSEGPFTGAHLPRPYSVLTPLGLLMAAGFGVLAAMAVFSYLYNSRSVNLMHALPIRREGLFLTNYVSGLAFLVAPQAAVALLTLAAQTARHCLDVGQVFRWFLVQTLFVLFFYSFAVFCAMFTGTLPALPVFYGILNVLAMSMSTLVTGLFSQFVYGFQSWRALESVAHWLTPAVVLGRVIRCQAVPLPGGVGDAYAYSLTGVPTVLLYALAGLLFAALALVVYRRRHLETAGDIVSVSWVRPVFKYGVAFCSAVALGYWLYSSIFSNLIPRGIYSMLALLLLSGLVGYFVAEMLLQKSFKVFRGAWKGGAVFCGVLVCSVLVMELDLVGFNRVPDRDRVASVALYGVYSYPNDSGRGTLVLTDPAELDDVLKLHRYAVEQRRAIQDELNQEHTRWEPVTLENGVALDLRLYDSVTVMLEYTLTDGSVISRRYTIPIYQSDLADPDSPAALLTGLLNRGREQLYFPDDLEGTQPVEVNLDVYHTEAERWTQVSIEGEDNRAALLAAVKSDLAAGRIGIRFLFEDLDRYETCYTSNLHFELFEYSPEYTGDPYRDAARSWGLEISLQTTASDTLACLTRLGVLDETHVLLTHVEHEALAVADAEPVDMEVEARAVS